MKKVLFINILVLITILFLIEFFIRVSFEITPQGISKGIIDISKNPKFNFPNISSKKVFGKKIYTDENGFRISDNFIKKDDTLEDIFFVGGSVTFGSGVAQSNTFSGILEKELSKNKIFNASVIGSHIENNLQIIEKKINTNNIKYIFVNFSLDDIENLNNLRKNNTLDMKKNNNLSFFERMKKNKFLIYINNFIRSKSVTYVFMKGIFLNSNERYYQYALNSYNENSINALSLIMKKYSEKNKKLKNKMIFLMIPYSFQISDENCNKSDFAETTIENKIINFDIKLIKFKEKFCNDDNKNQIFLKYDPSHLSRYGHTLVAKILKKEIVYSSY